MIWIVTINVYNRGVDHIAEGVMLRSLTHTFQIIADTAGQALDQAEFWMPEYTKKGDWVVQHRNIAPAPASVQEVEQQRILEEHE